MPRVTAVVTILYIFYFHSLYLYKWDFCSRKAASRKKDKKMKRLYHGLRGLGIGFNHFVAKWRKLASNTI
jgi:hypothetical protein